MEIIPNSRAHTLKQNIILSLQISKPSVQTHPKSEMV